MSNHKFSFLGWKPVLMTCILLHQGCPVKYCSKQIHWSTMSEIVISNIRSSSNCMKSKRLKDIFVNHHLIVISISFLCMNIHMYMYIHVWKWCLWMVECIICEGSLARHHILGNGKKQESIGHVRSCLWGLLNSPYWIIGEMMVGSKKAMAM